MEISEKNNAFQAAEHEANTNAWLNDRYDIGVGLSGIYLAHQPIYGWRKGYSDPAHGDKYRTSFAILKALSELEIGNLLDAGGGDGYTAALIRSAFRCDVHSSDISVSACRRAQEIFGVEATPGDLKELPFRESSFDTVVCSEALEHVVDPARAIDELLRVARRHVVITVPHEPPERALHAREHMEIHGHINHFDENSFDHLKQRGLSVHARRILVRTPWSNSLFALMESVDEVLGVFSSEWARRFFRRTSKFWRMAITKPLIGSALEWSYREGLSDRKHWYGATLVTIVKPGCELRRAPGKTITADLVLDFGVPYFRLSNKTGFLERIRQIKLACATDDEASGMLLKVAQSHGLSAADTEYALQTLKNV